MEYYHFFIVGIIWLVAGFINGLSGMGGALFAVPILSLVLNMQTNIAISCIIIPIICVMLAWNLRKSFDSAYLIPILLGAFPGTMVGTYILKYIPALYLQIIMAIILISYTIWSLFQKPINKPVRDSKLLIGVAGFFSGVSGASLSFFAPPLAIYVLYAAWTQARTMATFCMATFIMSTIACFFQGFAGLYTNEVIRYCLIAVPTAILGTILALPLIKYITQKTFKALLLIIIGASGFMSGIHALSTLNIL